MPSCLSVPVSCIDSDWLERDFKTPIRRFLQDEGQHGGLIWLKVDAVDEGNYLLHHVGLLAHELGRTCNEIWVASSDPFIFWEDFFGTTDHCGLLHILKARTLVLVKNGCYLPNKWIRHRLLTLKGLCLTHGLVLFIPIFHREGRGLNGHPDGTLILKVPPFKESPRKELRILAVELLRERNPDMSVDSCLQMALQLTEAGPNSRTELQQWVDHYTAQRQLFGSEAAWPPPELPRLVTSAPRVSTRSMLQSRFQATFAWLHEAGENFFSWLGRPLFPPVQDSMDPFQAQDPLHWFWAMVSYIYSLIMDAADSGLLLLLEYREGSQPGELVNVPRPHFCRLVGALRTTLQHSLGEGVQKNQEVVFSWYHECCKTVKPERYHWRHLTECLLKEWEELVITLRDSIRCIRKSSGKSSIEKQLAMKARNLSLHQWQTIIYEVIHNYQLPFDSGQLTRKHYSQLNLKLKESVISEGELLKEARKLAEEVIWKETARCPIEAHDLIALGVPPGKRIGFLLEEANQLYRQNPMLSKKELLDQLPLNADNG